MSFQEIVDSEKFQHYVKGSVGSCPASSTQVGGTHYKDMPMQPWDVMQAVMTHEEFVGFLKGNVIKYSMRAGKKAGTDDEGKARHYAQKLREVQEARRHG